MRKCFGNLFFVVEETNRGLVVNYFKSQYISSGFILISVKVFRNCCLHN